jgi:peptidoglycan/LPS O-acetylase OafA/YrhL
MTRRYQELASLTAWRGFAALAVAVHHATLRWDSLLAPLGHVGWLGVSFFYILSGFVLTWSFDPEISTRRYYVNRIARIYPLHLATLLFALLAFAVLQRQLAGYMGTPVGTALSVFLVHDWVPGHPEIRQAWNGVSWSLSAEFFFYLFAPFLIRRALRLALPTLVNIGACLYFVHLCVGIAAAKDGQGQLTDFLIYHPVSRIPEFIYGILAARLVGSGFTYRPTVILRTGLFVPLLVYCWSNPGNWNPVLMADLGIPAFVGVIVGAAITDLRQPGRFLGSVLWTRIGEASFSLYMTHALVLGVWAGALDRFHIALDPNVAVLAFLVIAAAASWVVYVYFELPARRWMLRRLRGSHAGRSATGADGPVEDLLPKPVGHDRL